DKTLNFSRYAIMIKGVYMISAGQPLRKGCPAKGFGPAPPYKRRIRFPMACILIVDDERDIRLMLTTYFSNHGYQVLCAQDGEQALSLLPGKVDLILLDIGMPGMD